jgi:hypothetical protein
MTRHLHLLLAAAALAAAGCADQAFAPEDLDHDHGAIAELSADELLSQLTRQGDFLVSAPLASETPFTRVGLMVNLKDEEDATTTPTVEARADGGEWIAATVAWREAGSLVLNVDLPAPATSAEVRIAQSDVSALHGVSWELFVPSDEQAAGAVDGDFDVTAPVAEQGLAGWLSSSGVRSKSSWGARASRGCSSNSSKNKIAIHHTVTGRTLNGSYERRLRQIQSFHMDSRGYCDVGYHFLVTADGRRWEGRPFGYLGAHVGGVNTGNVGISLVGCFHSSQCGGLGGTTPPNAMVNGTARLVRTVARRHGIAINTSRVKGHRQWAAGTACPGDNVASRLGTIRSRANSNRYP